MKHERRGMRAQERSLAAAAAAVAVAAAASHLTSRARVAFAAWEREPSETARRARGWLAGWRSGWLVDAHVVLMHACPAPVPCVVRSVYFDGGRPASSRCMSLALVTSPRRCPPASRVPRDRRHRQQED
ncbi:hypothetical protein PINS_up023504 [Pythium insidiosum]|nr:hypothetical protein PINS_up023504 [Pythium insidiosum]